MQSSGQGLTFTDQDVAMCRVVIGLLSRSTFSSVDAATIREGSKAFTWIEELVKNIKDNVLDFSTAKMHEPPAAPAAPAEGASEAK